MDKLLQNVFGIKEIKVDEDSSSEHFDNEDYKKLFATWVGGNTITDPKQIAEFAEEMYKKARFF